MLGGSRVRIQAWALVRLMVTPVLRIFTGSIMRQWEMGQKNSAGGGDGPPRDPRPLLSPPACLRSCFLSPALHPPAAQYCMSPPVDAVCYRSKFCMHVERMQPALQQA